jgi:hypothetical protein
MPVEVSREAGARGLPLVQPDIIPLGPEHPIEDHRHVTERPDRFGQVRTFQFREGPPMQPRCHQEVPIIIRISIQNNDGIRSAINHEVLPILVAGQTAAQEAFRRGLGRGGALLDILCTPGSPDTTQQCCLTPAETLATKPIGSQSPRSQDSRDRDAASGLHRARLTYLRGITLSRKEPSFRNGMSDPPARSRAIPMGIGARREDKTGNS